jgi:hypothetical protein
MILRRAGYRARQFFLALRAKPGPQGLLEAQKHLTPRQMALFERMQPGEQAHSLAVLHKLTFQGETDSDLLAAALLHDVGKTRSPLNVWERIWIVLVKKFAPARLALGGDVPLRGWQRPLVVAALHPAWGAAMASEAGCSPVTVTLIRQHQNPISPADPLFTLLHKLQAADDEA